VGGESDQELAIRTVVVSARAAIESCKKIGRPDMAAECARRGLTMLEGLREQLGPDVSDVINQQFHAALRYLASEAAVPETEVANAVRAERVSEELKRATR
jgi:hypothetical protein